MCGRHNSFSEPGVLSYSSPIGAFLIAIGHKHLRIIASLGDEAQVSSLMVAALRVSLIKVLGYEIAH